MEEIKNIEKQKKRQFVISLILSLAIISFLIGLWDIKSNAAESSYGVTINVVQHEYLNDEIFQEKNFTGNYISNSPIYIYHNEISIPQEKKAQIQYHLLSKEEIVIPGTIYKSEIITDKNGAEWHYIQYYSGSDNIHSGYSYCFDVDIQGAEKIYILNKYYSYYDFMDSFAIGDLDIKVDYNSFVESDDLPIVHNVSFDRLETSEYENGVKVKNVVDYLRFDSNSQYKLMIMLCPSIYSTYGSEGYIADFNNYEYPQWIYMCIADENLKEISCNLGEFIVPTNDLSDIKTSDYYLYYEELVNSFTNNDYSIFKPTMAYRLSYVDVENGLVGPSTYIKPFSYNNAYPDKETYSYFTLYADGSRNTEKIMNLKTWSAEYDASSGETSKDLEEVLQDMKDTVVNVGDYLKDKVVVDNDVDVKEVTNWLYSVVDFIKTTPSMVGTVLAFLPQPILYGMYVTIFLGCIASAIAIVKALI